jgi:hypothetical protein
MPLYPLLVLRARNVPQTSNNSTVYYLRPILGLSRSWERVPHHVHWNLILEQVREYAHAAKAFAPLAPT